MGRVKGHVPMRTCIACGSKRGQNELIRVILDVEGQLVRDDHGKRQGRGAYVCKNKTCREQMRKNKCLNRAFRGRKVRVISPDLKIPNGICEGIREANDPLAENIP